MHRGYKTISLVRFPTGPSNQILFHFPATGVQLTHMTAISDTDIGGPINRDMVDRARGIDLSNTPGYGAMIWGHKTALFSSGLPVIISFLVLV